MSWNVVVVAKFVKGLAEEVVKYKFVESQDDRHHGGQVQEEGLEGDDPRGQAHADAGFGGGHQEGQVLAGAGLGRNEEGGDDMRQIRRAFQCLEYYDVVELPGHYSGTFQVFVDQF